VKAGTGFSVREGNQLMMQKQTSHGVSRKRSIVKVLTAAVLGLGIFGAATPAEAVITYGGQRNTSAPTGDLAGSGWQYEGTIGSFTGTPIAPNYFITAKHIGQYVGQAFNYQGQSYTTTEAFFDPTSDLAIYKVEGTFDSYAPLYTSSGNEAGRQVVVHGRGLDRGDEVRVNGELKGWRYGANPGTQSWGTNTVASVYGKVFSFSFDAQSGANEGQVAPGDSGAGVFINDGGVWKLAGVNYAVENGFSLDGSDAGYFNAALFDKGGTYAGVVGGMGYIPDGSRDINSFGYATSVAGNTGFISSIVGASPVPEPTAALSLAAVGGLAALRRRRRTH